MLEKILKFIENTHNIGYHWIVRCLFWLVTIFFIFFIFSVNFLKAPLAKYFVLGVMFLTFTSYYFIVFSFKKSFIYGFLSLLFTLIIYQYYTYYCFSFLASFKSSTFFINVKTSIGELSYWQIPFNSKLFYFTYTMSLFHLAPPLGVKLIYELLKNFYQTQRLKEENLKLEISYLHAQINPHFLLNTLTAIYNMVMDNPKASKSIETLSALLHYSLYDTGSEKVPLDKEVQFIKDYIKLARIRLNRNKKLKLTITGSPKGLTIAPLILVNLVENCIKHGLHRVSGAAEAEVAINIENDTISLSTYNKTPDLSGTVGGIGLHNTQRRLNIYYPGQHELEIIEENGAYRVNLRIDLMQ